MGHTFSRCLAAVVGFAALSLAACAETPAPADAGPAVDARVTETDAASFGPPDPLLAPLDALRASSAAPVEFVFDRGVPAIVTGAFPARGDDPVARARDFLARHDALYRLDDPAIALRVRRVHTGDEDFVHLYQVYGGLPVEGADLVVNLVGGEVRAAYGAMIPSDRLKAAALDLRPAIGPGDAIAAARRALGTTTAPAAGETELVVVDPTLPGAATITPPRLAYRVTLPSAHVLVDAHDGAVVRREALTHTAFDLDLEDANGSDAASTICYALTAADDDAADENGVYPSHAGQPAVELMYQYQRDAYGYFSTNFGRDSFDGAGSQLDVYVSVGEVNDSPNNAGYSSFCGLFEFTNTVISYDIAVHELTHAVIRETSDLEYCGASGAINESLADLMGAFARGSWKIGEGSTFGVVRNLQAPASRHHSQYVGSSDCDSDNDYGYVHTNSQIVSYAGYWLTAGGTIAIGGRLIELNGLGVEKARRLFYDAMVNMPSQMTFAVYATAIWQRALGYATSHRYGFTVADACTVRTAFASVGLGALDVDCDGTPDGDDGDDDGDGVPDANDNCPGIPNPSQLTGPDFDGIANACDPDDDDDGVLDANDNCWRHNPLQQDADNNGVGDLCEDFDADGVGDETDNCALTWNASQDDIDLDGYGDACDPDDDGDLTSNDDDNCPFDPNIDQADNDGDGLGNVCDRCRDVAETVIAWTTGFADLGIAPQPIVPDGDHDGLPDACDPRPWGDLSLVSIDAVVSLPSVGTLAPDGTRHSGVVRGSAGEVLTQPLLECDGTCPAWFVDGQGLTVTLTGLVDDVSAWITDERGLTVARSSRSERSVTGAPLPRALSFRLDTGRRYALNFGFRPSVTAGQSFRFTVSSASRP